MKFRSGKNKENDSDSNSYCDSSSHTPSIEANSVNGNDNANDVTNKKSITKRGFFGARRRRRKTITVPQDDENSLKVEILSSATNENENNNEVTTVTEFSVEVTNHLPPNASNVIMNSVDNSFSCNNAGAKSSPPPPPKLPPSNLRVLTTTCSTINVLNSSIQTQKTSNTAVYNNNATPHPSPYNNSLDTPTPLATRKLPALFILIEQNNWPKAAERAKKYPHECQKWITMKRKSNHPGNLTSASTATTTASSISNHNYLNTSLSSIPSSPSSIHSGPSSPSSAMSNSPLQIYDTINSLSSSSSIATIGTSTSAATSGTLGYTHVKCKALHHACHKLRNVHSHIRKLIAIEMYEYNKYIEMQKIMEQQRLEQIDNAKTSPCASPSSCHLAAASSFDEFVDSGKKIAGRFSPRLGKVGKLSPRFGEVVDRIKRNISSPLSRHEEDAEWDDPWIEACKTILTILQVFPEVAHSRETRHGCLPLHLAAFAMCPTPSVRVPDDYKKFKYDRRDDNQSSPSSSPSSYYTTQNNTSSYTKTPKRSHIGDGAAISSNEDLQQPVPPRPRSNSAASCSSANLSLGGFSSVLMDGEGGYGSIGASSSFPLDKFTHDLSSSMESMENLRFHSNSSLENDGKRDLKLLEPSSRPPSFKDNGDREISTGSMYSLCSISGVSTESITINSSTESAKSEKEEFYLDKYVKNEKRRNQFSLKVIDALINAYRKGVAKDSEGGRLPLHTALAGRATIEVIETIVRAYPYAARHRTKDASLPLHIAAYHGTSHADVAPTLLRHYPFATVGKNRYGRTPLEEALLMGGENGRKHQLQLVEALRKPEFYWTSPEQSNILTSSNVVKEVSEKQQGERTLACVDDFVDEDYDDNNIASLIVRQEWDIIMDRIEEFTEAIQSPMHTPVRAGYMARVSAVHLACEQNPTYEILDALVGVQPEALTWRQLPGAALPLHIATTWNASSSVIGYLLAANPQAARQRDAIGNLPLHCACFSGASDEIIESLLCTYPMAVNVKNMQGSRPRDVVERLSHPNKKTVMKLMDDVSLELLQKKRISIIDQDQEDDGAKNNVSDADPESNEDGNVMWV